MVISMVFTHTHIRVLHSLKQVHIILFEHFQHLEGFKYSTSIKNVRSIFFRFFAAKSEPNAITGKWHVSEIPFNLI